MKMPSSLIGRSTQIMKTFNELTSRSSSKAVVDEMESDNGLNSKDHKQVKQKCEIPFFYGN